MLFRFFCSEHLQANTLTVLSCAVSYIWVSLISVTGRKWGIQGDALSVSAIAIILSTVTAVPMAKLYTSRWLSGLLERWFHKSVNKDIWGNVLDYENGEDSWLALSGFTKIDKSTGCETISGTLNNEDALILFRLKDVEHMEIIPNQHPDQEADESRAGAG